jgi:uncharacterized protein (TIGR02757 family)
MRLTRIKRKLEGIYSRLDAKDFLMSDPLGIPHYFQKREDIEISGFFAAILAWGRRDIILRNTWNLMDMMGREPHRFIMDHSESDLKPLSTFVHRTFNGTDLLFFVHSLKRIYQKHESLEDLFVGQEMKQRIIHFHKEFLSAPFLSPRTVKHVANPGRNSSAKRLNMYLRWMVRNDEMGLDLGIWKKIPCNELRCPLDVHVQRAAMELGLLKRPQQDWKAVDQLSENLKELNNSDPIRYDIPLFLYGQELGIKVF